MINTIKKEGFPPDPGTIVLRQKDINLITGKPFRIKTCCSSQMLINTLREEDTVYLLDLQNKLLDFLSLRRRLSNSGAKRKPTNINTPIPQTPDPIPSDAFDQAGSPNRSVTRSKPLTNYLDCQIALRYGTDLILISTII
ncbi:hypothetical protein TNCV_3893941 [Trichonephila clavipes]|nr:hypothetical protein TNCV_3893941 [Trichonephila clavipes]